MKKFFNEIIMFILILLLFEPNIAVKYNLFNNVFVCGSVISFIFITMLIIREKKTINKITLLMIIFRTLLICTTIYNNGDILKVGYQSIIIISLMLYAEYYYRNDKILDFINILSNILTLYLFINIILYILYPNGLYLARSGIHFLGIRTRFTEYSMLLLLLNIINYQLKIENIKIFIFKMTIVLLNIFIPRIATAIIGLIIFILVYIFFKKKIKINYKLIFAVSLIITALIVFFRIQDIFSYVIVDLLHKDLTLTGRTSIWDKSYTYIFDKFVLFGHGMKIDGNFVFWRVQLWQAHNQLLQILYEGGILGTILFYEIFFMSLAKLNHTNQINEKIKKSIGAMFFSFGIMMITEIYGYYLPTYILIILAYYSNKIIINNEKEELKCKKLKIE